MNQLQKEIRASFNEKTIRVYQAYNNDIADSALKAKRFISPPFKRDRMTWIKPSFLWMMYRSGWGQKDVNQSRILAIDILRTGFEWALQEGISSSKPENVSQDEWQDIKQASPVRVQWDPERDIELNPLPYRTIQIGLSKLAVEYYLDSWIQKITDITPVAHEVHAYVKNGKMKEAKALLPKEDVYPLSKSLQIRIGATCSSGSHS